jgi:hypothetical protein
MIMQQTRYIPPTASQARVMADSEGNGIATRVALQPEILPNYTYQDMQQMANAAAASGLFKMTPAQILTLMMLCQSEGIHPIKALAMYDVADGRPSMKSVYMLARFTASGGSIEWVEASSSAAEARFLHPQSCPRGVLIRYTVDDAKIAGLAGKDNWRKHPGDMLVWRVVSRGVKRANPACLFGLDIPEPEEQSEPAESPAQKALVETLAKQRERPQDTHPPVANTVQELKQAQAAEPRPATEPQWALMINDALIEVNKAIAQLAEENPGNLELRKPITSHQAIRGVLKAMVESGELEPDSLNTNGKQDKAKVTAKMAFLWSDDREDLEARVAKYLGQKVTAMVDQAKSVQPLPMG